jgi:CRISPR-associated protein Cas5a/b/c
LRTIFFHSRLRLSWGFVVRVPGTTAAQPALSLPPPTTVVGAFSNPVLELLKPVKDVKRKRGETLYQVFDCILGSTLAAGFALARENGGATGIAVIEEVSRIVGAPYKTGGEAGRIKVAGKGPREFLKAVGIMLPVQALGVAYAPAALADIVWVADAERLATCLGVKVEELYGDLGKVVTWGVSRLGSKEGIVVVIQGHHGSPEQLKCGSIFKTRAYVPADCVEPKDEDVSEVTLWGLDYRWRRYYVPFIASGTVVYPPAEAVSYRLVSEKCYAFRVPVLEDLVVVSDGGEST